MKINPYQSPEAAGDPPERKPRSWRPTLIGVLTATGVILLLGALFLPATRNVPEASRRSLCSSNLKQIAIALSYYETVYHSLPPAYTVDADGKALHSWRTLILPFMEEQERYDKIDLSKPWDDPANHAASETPLSMYRCPSVDCPETHTTYLAVVAPGGCFHSKEPRKLSEIKDDKDWTLMVVEVDAKQAVHWMSPADATDLGNLTDETAATSPHPSGANVATVSGRVLFLRTSFRPEQLRALISIDGNDDAIASKFD